MNAALLMEIWLPEIDYRNPRTSGMRSVHRGIAGKMSKSETKSDVNLFSWSDSPRESHGSGDLRLVNALVRSIWW